MTNNPKDTSNKFENNFINCKEIKLQGKHNYENIIVCLEICKLLKVNFRSIKNKLTKIKPLEHRMEFVATNNSIKFINDSKGTNINSTVNAIKSFNNNIILILGGYSKGKIQYSHHINSNLKQIKSIICYGQEGKNIYKDLSENFKCKYINDFTKCINYAIKIANKGEIVLMSPACSSFDQFKSFEERGEKFKNIVSNYNFL